MRDVRSISLLFIIVNLLLVAQAQSAMMNGIGEYKELGRPVFIASLFTDAAVTNADQLLSEDATASMNMRITANKMSQRRFVSLWVESISINTLNETFQQQTENLLKFTSYFQGALYKNDMISLSYNNNDAGLDVYLNEVLLGSMNSVNSGEFFRMLLASWIGDIPLSSSLKERLLSPDSLDSVILEAYNSFSYSPSRRDEALRWRDAIVHGAAKQNLYQAPLDKLESNSQYLAIDEIQSTTEKAAIPTELPNNNKTAQQRSDVLSDAAGPQDQLEDQKMPPSLEDTLEEPVLPDEPLPEQAKLSSAVVEANSRNKGEEPKGNGMRALREAGKAGGLESEELFVLRQVYTDKLVQAVLKNQSLPRKAFLRRMEGDVKLVVKVDRNGKVMSVKIAQKSEHNILNKQAVDAVKQAQPFPAVPADFPEEKFIFSVALNYRLPY